MHYESLKIKKAELDTKVKFELHNESLKIKKA